MPEGQVLEFDRVTKRFGDVAAVSDFSGRVEPGVVTGFLGPNGAGKTTTLLMLLGQVRPTSGTATIGGSSYAELKHPARVIGAMYEDPGFRPRRTVERHLLLAAKANGIPASRVAEVISFVGLDNEAHARIGALSLGMRQRLSAATALLGDPGALVLDEPANGLDPEGIRWMRMLIRGLADEGRTVLISSHVLSEVEQVADDILVISHGERRFAGSLSSLADPTAGPVVVDAADRSALSDALTTAGFDFEILRSGLTVRGSDAARIGAVAANAGVALTTLQQRGPTLEDVFLDIIKGRPVQVRQPQPADAAATEETSGDEAGIASDDHADTADVAAAQDAPGEEQSHVATGDEDHEEEDSAASFFAPVSAAQDDRPLPGTTGLAAAAASVNAPGGTGEPIGSVSPAWAALLSGQSAENEARAAQGDETRVISIVPAVSTDTDEFTADLSETLAKSDQTDADTGADGEADADSDEDDRRGDASSDRN